MRHQGGQQEHLALPKDGDLGFVLGAEVVEVQLALELVEDLVAGVDVEVGTGVGTAGHEDDEVRVLPDDSSPAPVRAVLVDPVSKIETGQMWEHGVSFHGRGVRSRVRAAR